MGLTMCENYFRKSLSLSDANHLFINQITKNCEEKTASWKANINTQHVSGASVWLESSMFRFVSMFLSRDSIINCEKVSLCNVLINEEAPKLRVSPFRVRPPCYQLDKDKLVADLLDPQCSSMLDRTLKNLNYFVIIGEYSADILSVTWRESSQRPAAHRRWTD